MKRVTPSLARMLCVEDARKEMEGVVEQVEKLCDEVESVKKFSYLGDRVSVGGDVRRL